MEGNVFRALGSLDVPQRQACLVWLGMAAYSFTTSQNTLVCVSSFDDSLEICAGLIQEEKTKDAKSTES